MPPAARTTDSTGHGPPLSPGPGSPTVLIGNMPAWRALPSSVGGAVESLSNTMQSFMSTPVLNPGSAGPKVPQIVQGMTQASAQAAAAGNPSAVGAAASQSATLSGAMVALTATWTAASAVPGGQPAADQAFTQGIKAAAGAAATAVFSAIGAMADMHVCSIPVPPMPHGPGLVAQGSSTVQINKLPAARQGDKVMEACGGADPIAMGCTQVIIGG